MFITNRQYLDQLTNWLRVCGILAILLVTGCNSGGMKSLSLRSQGLPSQSEPEITSQSEKEMTETLSMAKPKSEKSEPKKKNMMEEESSSQAQHSDEELNEFRN